ncbi:MAG: DUF423 domain-containing protein [Pseudomonadota bacterium]
MLIRLVAALCGVCGAAGVATLAAAAHAAAPGEGARFSLSNAGIMMMVHAAGALAVLAWSDRRHEPRVGSGVAAGMVVGALLFGGAVALPQLFAFTLFPMAAPIGGSLTIASWMLLVLLAILAGRSGSDR